MYILPIYIGIIVNHYKDPKYLRGFFTLCRELCTSPNIELRIVNH